MGSFYAMAGGRGLLIAALGALLLLPACATPDRREPSAPSWFSLGFPATPTGSVRLDSHGTYLYPNAADADGAPAFVHVTAADMPLVVALPHPVESPKGGSRRDARRAVVGALCLWELAIRDTWPAFQLRFVEEDPAAPVQVRWKRQMRGSAVGRAGMQVRVAGGELRVGGAMVLAGGRKSLSVDEIRLVASHEFGHVLGLRHCLECDSAMNYSWETRKRLWVTRTDARTFRALLRARNGFRTDGRPLRALLARGWDPVSPQLPPIPDPGPLPGTGCPR